MTRVSGENSEANTSEINLIVILCLKNINRSGTRVIVKRFWTKDINIKT